MRAALFVLSLLLAGCVVAPASTATTDAVAPREARQATALEGCVVIEALTKLPAAAVAPHVPPGFAPEDDGTGVFAILGGSDCETGGARAFFAIQVRPVDPALEGEGVGRYYWEPEHHLGPGGAFGQQALALGALAGIADIAATQAAAGATLAVEGDGWEHRVETPVGALTPAAGMAIGGVFREYFPAAGGYAYLEASFDVDPSTPFTVTPATVRTGASTLPRDLLGAEATLVAGVADVSYGGASLGFVPYP